MAVSLVVTLMALRAARPPAMAALQWAMVAIRAAAAVVVVVAAAAAAEVVVLVEANKALMANGTKLRRARTSTMDLEVINLERKKKASEWCPCEALILMDGYGA